MSIKNGLLTMTAGAALSEGQRVVVVAGSTTTPPEVNLAPAGATASHIGYVERGGATGELVTIRPKTMDGNKHAVASAAIAVGAVVYGSANGRVSTTLSGNPIGQAVTAAAAAGDIIEILEY